MFLPYPHVFNLRDETFGVSKRVLGGLDVIVGTVSVHVDFADQSALALFGALPC